MIILRPLSKLSRTNAMFALMFFALFLMLLLTVPQTLLAAGADTGVDSTRQPVRVPTVTVKDAQQRTFSMFTGDEVFYRPGRKWGFKLNLSGFSDLRQKVSGLTIVGFGIREDSVGLTLAHLYVNSMSKDDSLTTPQYYANRLYESLRDDTTVLLNSVLQGQEYGLETIEYDRIEVWPQPDPNNPGKMFDSTLVRRHLNAITTYRNSWIELHLSKTDYLEADSSVFDDLLKTFSITEDVAPTKLEPVNTKSTRKP